MTNFTEIELVGIIVLALVLFPFVAFALRFLMWLVWLALSGLVLFVGFYLEEVIRKRHKKIHRRFRRGGLR